MDKRKLKQLFLLLALVLVIYPSTQAHAKVHSFGTLYMEVNIPDDAIILTAETPNTDEHWKDVGITDPKSEKESFDDMGVQAIIYDPNTDTLVRLLQKQTSDSRDIFHLSLLSEDELTEYLDTLFTSTDENTQYTMEKYSHQETPFYRLNLEMTKEGGKYSEVIYGSIVNGYSISYDLFDENITEPFDESFIKELVAGTHFTEFLDKSEVEQQEREAYIMLIVIMVCIIVIIVVWVLIRKKATKKQKLIKKQKAEELSRFYTVQRKKEEQNIKDTSIFHNRTKYSEEIIKNFNIYTRIFKPLKLWIITVLIYLLLLISLFTSGSIIGGAIAIIALIAFLYHQGFQIEKMINREIKSYKNNKNMEAVFTFYEDYYTLSGIQSTSKYPYVLITEIKEYKDCIYLYLGSDRAHYLKKDGFEKGLEEFEKFIKEQI